MIFDMWSKNNFLKGRFNFSSSFDPTTFSLQKMNFESCVIDELKALPRWLEEQASAMVCSAHSTLPTTHGKMAACHS